MRLMHLLLAVMVVLALTAGGACALADTPTGTTGRNSHTTARWHGVESDFYFQDLHLASGYSRSRIWSGHFRDYVGKAWDASGFYKRRGIAFEGKLDLLQHLSYKQSVDSKTHEKNHEKSVFLRHRIHFDSGYKAKLHKVNPYISWSPQAIVPVSEAASVAVGISNLLWLGGNVYESPCVDSFERQFHCGTGLPWSDYALIAESDYTPERSIFIQYVRVF